MELAGRIAELSSKLRGLESLASRLEVAVKPLVFSIGADLELLCNVMEARNTYRPCRYMDSGGYCRKPL